MNANSHQQRTILLAASLLLLWSGMGADFAYAQELQLQPVSNFLTGLVNFLLGPVGTSIGILIWLATVIAFGLTRIDFSRLVQVSLLEVAYFGSRAIITGLQNVATSGVVGQ